MKKILLILFMFFSLFGFSQQDVFNRSDANTGDFGSGNLPWFYQTSNNNQGDPDNGNTVSNNVKIGHNNFTTMITNGRFYRVRTLEFQAAATSNRTINNSGGGLGVSFGVYNNSSGSHIFNTPIGIDGATVQLQANSGPFTFTTDIFMNANTVEFGGSNNTLVSGILQGTGKLVKNGTGFLTLSNTNTYSGNTELDNGELWIETTGNAIANNNIFLGNGGLLGNTTKIFLSRAAGGTTFSRNINVNPGNANTRFLGGLNTSGTNTFSGSILRSATGRPLTIEVVNAGGTVAFTGVINGSDNITKIGPGTMQLGTNSSTMTGTWFVENGTLLTDSFPARLNARPITLGTASTSGTLRFTTTSAATTSLQFNVNAGGGAIYNASTSNLASNTGFTTNGPLTVGAENTGNLTFGGAIAGSGSVTYNSTGTGKVVLGIAMTYTGATRITSGTMETNGVNRIANTSNIIMNGGTYSTGATIGYGDTVGTLQLLENSTIRLGDGGNTHTLTFAASNGVSWTSGRTLTITNWSGTPGTGGTASAGSIFVGAAATSLTAAQLDQITFQGYEPGAVLKSSGELMPKGYITYYSKGSLAPEVLTNWSLTTDGTGASPANFTSTARFVIQNGHTMTTGAAWTLSGASTTLQILNGGSLVSTFAVTIPTTGIFQIDNGGLYKHDNVSAWGSTIFNGTEVFGNSSTVEINKTNTNLPTNSSYGNLTIDLSVDPGVALSFAGNLTTVNGNFVVRHTRGRQVRLAASSGPTITIFGNFEVHPNADFAIVTGTGNTVINVDGNINLVGGTFSLATSTGVGFLVARGPSVTISENVTFAGALPGATGFYFNRNVEQTLTIAHPFSSGNVRNRFFVSTVNSNVINEVYNGVAAQTTIDGTGVVPGTGWSRWQTATAGTALKSFTINNSAGVTLSTNRFVNTTLGLTNGTITPGANSLTLAATATFTGGSATSHVNGVLNRVYTTTGSAVFPVGKAGVYRPVGFQYTALTGTSTVSVNQIETALTGTLPANTNLNNARTWDISQTGGSAFTYNVTLDPTGDTTTGTVAMLKKEGTITSNATTSPNFTNATGFTTLTGINNFTLGSTCTVTSNAGTNQTICTGASVTLAANTPSFGTGAWTVSGPSTNVSQFSNTTSPTSTFTPNGGAGIYTLTWTITNGSCTSNSNVTITVSNNISWIGTTGLWSNAANWSCGSVPLDTSIITISSGTPTLDTNFTVGSTGSLTLSGTASSLIIAPTASLTVAGSANFNARPVLFESDATGTAEFGAMTGTLSGATNVTTQRYFPAKRAFRFTSSAVTTNTTIRENWQENVNNSNTTFTNNQNPNPGFGTHITGAGGSANGFDTTISNASSLFTFNNSTALWTAVANTNVNRLDAGVPYRINVRGDRSIDMSLTSPTATPTTLRATGTLYTGTFEPSNLSSTAFAYNFIGNPYQAPVNMKTVLDNATNLNNLFYYVWDPRMGTRGAYISVDLNLNTPNNITSASTKFLQPGQACFVRTVANGGATMTFEESYKNLSGSNNLVFKNANQSISATSNIKMSLYDSNSLALNQTALDGSIIFFDDSNNNGVDQNDAAKFANPDEMFSTFNNGALISIEKRMQPTTSDIIPIRISQYRGTNYTIVAQGENLNGIPAYLHDQFLQTYTEIPQSGSVNYPYTVVTTNTQTSATDRFRIVYSNPLLNTANNEWKNFTLYPNPSKQGNFNIILGQPLENGKVTIYNTLGVKVYNQDLENTIENSITPNQSMPIGIYFVEIQNGNEKSIKKLLIE